MYEVKIKTTLNYCVYLFRDSVWEIGLTIDDTIDKKKLNYKIKNKRTGSTLTHRKSRLQLTPNNKEGNDLMLEEVLG